MVFIFSSANLDGTTRKGGAGGRGTKRRWCHGEMGEGEGDVAKSRTFSRGRWCRPSEHVAAAAVCLCVLAIMCVRASLCVHAPNRREQRAVDNNPEVDARASRQHPPRNGRVERREA